MRWYDRYSRAPAGGAGSPAGGGVERRKWRSEKQWPPADAKTYTANLKPGSYTDDTTNNGTPRAARRRRGHLDLLPAFAPRGALRRGAQANGQPDHQLPEATSPPTSTTSTAGATPRSSAAHLPARGATGTISFDLYGDDWVLPAGHRIGVLIGSSNSEWWTPTPTFQPVTVNSANITLGFLSCARTKFIQGESLDQARQLQGRLAPSRSTRRRSRPPRPGLPGSARAHKLRLVGAWVGSTTLP